MTKNNDHISEAMSAFEADMPDEEILYDLADLFKVFSDTTRIKILYSLMGGELCVADIAETIEIANAVELGDSPLFPDFAADEHIYLGVIANTPRQEQSLDYLDYVLGLQ